MTIAEQIAAYTPVNEQEARDRALLFSWLESGQDIYTRNPVAHLTASAWVVSPDRQQVLMIYHNLYNSWSWMGGHADGNRDLLQVARQEVMEESGLKTLKLLSPDLFSLEILTVDGHIKRGSYVSSHLHLNVTYLFEADTEQALAIKPDENSGVAWFPVAQLSRRVSEPWFLKWIYSKLCDKVVHSGL